MLFLSSCTDSNVEIQPSSTGRGFAGATGFNKLGDRDNSFFSHNILVICDIKRG
jgi:hypothetical protein